MDREFGLMHVRVQTWFTFMIQVYVNGQEWLARAKNKEGIEYKKTDNCFTAIKNVERAQELSDRLGDRKSTRLNSSHQIISYAVFCLKKKNNIMHISRTTHEVPITKTAGTWPPR